MAAIDWQAVISAGRVHALHSGYRALVLWWVWERSVAAPLMAGETPGPRPIVWGDLARSTGLKYQRLHEAKWALLHEGAIVETPGAGFTVADPESILSAPGYATAREWAVSPVHYRKTVSEQEATNGNPLVNSLYTTGKPLVACNQNERVHPLYTTGKPLVACNQPDDFGPKKSPPVP